MVVKGIGTDLVSVQRFEQLLLKRSANHMFKFSNRFLNTNYELPFFVQIYNNSNTSDKQRIQLLAQLLSTSWCLKELCYKSLSMEQQRKFRFKEWYKSNDKYGKPLISHENKNGDFDNDQFLVSLSHDGGFVTSTVLRQ